MDAREEIQESVVNKALKFFENNDRGHINAAMRFGKILCTLKILNKLPITTNILIAYPDNRIRESWEGEIIKWGYNFDITYVNFSSLHKYRDKHFSVFTIDEWHTLSNRELAISKIISDNANITLGLSGTVSKETQDRWLEFKEIAKYTTLQGISDGIVSDYRITVHLVDLDTITKTPNKKGKLLSEKQMYENYSYVISKMKQDGRNFMHLALARNRLALSSIGKIEFTKKLLSNLKDKRVIVFTGLNKTADSLDIPSYHSDSTNNFNFLAFQEGHINRLALSQMGKMGVSFRNLDCVIMMNYSYNASDTAQSLNRAISLDYSGKCADLRIVALREPAELKKVKESLSMLDQKKITYK